MSFNWTALTDNLTGGLLSEKVHDRRFNQSKDPQPIIDRNGLRLGAYSPTHDHVVMTLYILMGVLGVCFNVYTIFVLLRSHKTSSIKLQLINLAIADLLTALFMPGYLIHHMLILEFPEIPSLATFFCFTSLAVFYTGPLWNVTISLERFVAVYFPFHMLRYEKKWKILVACLVWIAGLASASEGLIYGRIGYFNTKQYGTQVPMAVCYNSPSERTAHVVLMVLKYTLPPVIIAVMYLLIIVKICRRPVQQPPGAARDLNSKQKQQKEQVSYQLFVKLYSYLHEVLLNWWSFLVGFFPCVP